MKLDDLSPAHLSWLVESRARNQRASLRLFELFEKYPNRLKNKTLNPTAQTFVSVTFSLWRAAFLADKTGLREAVFTDARVFLGKMLTDNAINYPQDRSAREWTFNYYMVNANKGLLDLSKRWPKIDSVLSARKKVAKGTTAARRRWDRHQTALETAVEYLKADLTGQSKAKS